MPSLFTGACSLLIGRSIRSGFASMSPACACASDGAGLCYSTQSLVITSVLLKWLCLVTVFLACFFFFTLHVWQCSVGFMTTRILVPWVTKNVPLLRALPEEIDSRIRSAAEQIKRLFVGAHRRPYHRRHDINTQKRREKIGKRRKKNWRNVADNISHRIVNFRSENHEAKYCIL